VVQFAQDGAGEHKITGQVPVGANPGSFSISPDGKSMVTVNAGTSAQPWGATAGGSSLTLLKVDDAGVLTKVADYPFDGILAQSVAFDKDGSNIAVSVFEYLDYGNRAGGIEFWTVDKAAPALKKQAGRVSVERGVHTIRVIP
jgi:DNA-binding beta-propeller fold protein YncE